MAEQITIDEAVKTVKKTAKKAAPKRKAPAKKATAKKATAKKKPAVKRKPAAKRKATAKKASPDFAARAKESGRNAFLASLGFYGKAFDQVQDQFDSIQKQLEDRRKNAEKTYKELVKRGEKVEKEAKKAVDDIELPKFELDSLTDRQKLDAQLDKAKARFEELKESVSFKTAA
jgi:polyhydroxyalkanoate synthesis regulator phasin